MNAAEAPPPRIDIARADLDDAATRGLLPPDTVAALWTHLAGRGAGTARRRTAAVAPAPESPRFSFTHLLYYFGGLLAIGAATLFMTEGFQRLGSWALFAIAVAYAAACVWAAARLDARGLAIPAGIVATLAICLVPLATWAIQHAFGLWPEGGTDNYRRYHTHIDWRWLTLEFGTLAAAVVMLWRYRLPFMVMPVAVTVW